jgi:hypothetical protein
VKNLRPVRPGSGVRGCFSARVSPHRSSAGRPAGTPRRRTATRARLTLFQSNGAPAR